MGQFILRKKIETTNKKMTSWNITNLISLWEKAFHMWKDIHVSFESSVLS
jgi:hypothetical protein